MLITQQTLKLNKKISVDLVLFKFNALLVYTQLNLKTIKFYLTKLATNI
jgi:hypothetical protein